MPAPWWDGGVRLPGELVTEVREAEQVSGDASGGPKKRSE